RVRGPSFSGISPRVGEFTTSITPSPAPNPFANCVLPAPSSPMRHSRSPGSPAGAGRAPRARVVAGSPDGTTTASEEVTVRGYRATPSGAVRDPSGEAFEIRERKRHGRGLVEADPTALELRARLEAAQAGEALKASLATRVRPVLHTDEVGRERRQDQVRHVPHDRRRV